MNYFFSMISTLFEQEDNKVTSTRNPERSGMIASGELFLDKFRLDGKVALITGASWGIGRAIALGLAEAGADIVLASRKLPDLEAVAQEIFQRGRRALAVSANVRVLPEIDDLVKKGVKEFHHVV